MREMDAGQNLLFGALALKADLINERQFVEACSVWQASASASLSDLLVDSGWITPEDRREVESLVARQPGRDASDGRAGLTATVDLIRAADETMARDAYATTPRVGAREHERYTLTRLHAEGGLGKVWLARDTHLNRDVALKEIRTEQSVSPEAWRRFLKEAQVTGQLEHPNIVPVYDLDRRSGSEQPFYTMRMVRGRTMCESIAEYHKRRREAAADPLELRKLLQAFTSVCQAIAYAHSRSVIHRDLKSANVILGGFGEVIVLDWGLAKTHASTDDEQAYPSLILSDDADAGETRAGELLGTPAYMAPEQAAGRVDLIDGRTDVYGLGAILFEILTGEPPHRGTSMRALLRTIVTADTPRARRLEPTVPSALDSVCAKAMAKSPADRYGTPTELADDVQRWLADEPVSTLREPPIARLARLMRKHRTGVAMSAVLLVAAVIGLAIGNVVLGQANDRNERLRFLAEKNLRQARLEALDREIEQKLREGQWPENHLATLDDLVTRLEQIEPSRALAARTRIDQRFAETLGETLRRPVLSETDVATVERSLAVLDGRLPSEAASLRKSLSRRLYLWQPVCDVKAPFASLDTAFDITGVHVRDNALLPSVAAEADNGAPVVSKIGYSGNFRCEATFDEGWTSASSLGLILRTAGGHARAVKTLAVSADGHVLASGGDDRQVRVWNLAERQLIATLPDHGAPVLSVAFSPDGKSLATSAGIQGIRLWDAATGTLRRTMENPEKWQCNLLFTRDGATLIAGSAQSIQLWDLVTGRLRSRIEFRPGAISGLAISSDDRLLGVSSWLGQVSLFELASGRLLATLTNGPGAATALAFSPDGRTLAFSLVHEGEFTIALWDVAANRFKGQPKVAPGWLAALGFTPDGQSLVTAIANGQIGLVVWDHSTWRPRSRAPIAENVLVSMALIAGTSETVVGCYDGTITHVEGGQSQTLFQSRGYTFLLTAEDGPNADGQARAPAAPATKPRLATRAKLQILRDQVVLREQTIAPGDLPRGPLTLEATQDGEQLRFRVGPNASLTFRDSFPLTPGARTGAVELIWPTGIPLERLHVTRLAAPPAPSPLERGDDLYLRGRFVEALAAYQEQAIASHGSLVESQAQYKQALCMIALKREAEATALLERLATQSVDQWSALATASLWALKLEQNRLDEVEATFESLVGRFRFAELAALVPADLRARMLGAYRSRTANIAIAIPDPQHIKLAQHAVEVTEYFRDPAQYEFKHTLARCLWIAGQEQDALRVLEDATAQPDKGPGVDGQVVCVTDLAWLLRFRGDAHAALRLLDGWIPLNSGLQRPTLSVLRLERIRTRVALGQWDEAEQETDALFREYTTQDMGYAFQDICLVRGFLRERRGDTPGALEAWRAGLAGGIPEDMTGQGGRFVSGVILASLTGGLTIAKADALAGVITGAIDRSNIGGMKLPAFPSRVLTDAWHSSRGRESARQFAFRSQPFPEIVHMPFLVVGYEYVRQSIGTDVPSPDQDQVLWDLSHRLIDAFQNQRLTRAQLIQLGLAWKGTLGFLGWGGVAPTLAADLRGPLSYALASRLLKKGRPADAERLLNAATRDAPRNSRLRRLIDSSLSAIRADRTFPSDPFVF